MASLDPGSHQTRCLGGGASAHSGAPEATPLLLVREAPNEVQHLEKLRGTYPARDIQLFFGDFNAVVHDVLNREVISEKEATFCLLDQRTFQCISPEADQ